MHPEGSDTRQGFWSISYGGYHRGAVRCLQENVQDAASGGLQFSFIISLSRPLAERFNIPQNQRADNNLSLPTRIGYNSPMPKRLTPSKPKYVSVTSTDENFVASDPIDLVLGYSRISRPSLIAA